MTVAELKNLKAYLDDQYAVPERRKPDIVLVGRRM